MGILPDNCDTVFALRSTFRAGRIFHIAANSSRRLPRSCAAEGKRSQNQNGNPHKPLRVHGDSLANGVRSTRPDALETLPPGISACTPGKNLTISHRGTGSGEAYSHEGEEFLYLLHGQLEIALEDGETYRLDEGDSFYFESTMQHRWSNPGKKEAWVLWVNTPPTF